MNRRVGFHYVLLLACVIAAPARAEADRDGLLGLFLTWQDDPTSTITIDWHRHGDSQAAWVFEYKPVDGDEWLSVESEQIPFPFSERIIHRVAITGLAPAEAYRFRIDGQHTYWFRTMPENAHRPIRFAVGGDTRHNQRRMERTNRVVMEYDPDFIVWGGDLAYADGEEENLYRWYEWFDAIKNTLVTDDRRVVPILVGIGNHEVVGGYYRRYDDYEQTDEWRREIAPYFFGGLFAFPGQPGWGVIDFADYMSIVILDSEHANPVEGEQTDWLKQVLDERQDVAHLLPVYHVPAFPSVRSYDGWGRSDVREHWVPLFEQHNIRVAFENHDHAYKRTYPIRDERIADDGIVYIGDGAWGVGTRETHPVDETWYLKRAEPARHAIIATIHGVHQHFLVVSEEGEVIDEYPETPPRPASSYSER